VIAFGKRKLRFVSYVFVDSVSVLFSRMCDREHYTQWVQVAAAHSCYLVAELNIDSYSESARLCLIGADHLKCPRTFASPEAIQRTEVYEYAKVLGNSQYILLPFQPYKLIYAYMLAEVGKISDSLR
jgi:hypothetical protein